MSIPKIWRNRVGLRSPQIGTNVPSFSIHQAGYSKYPQTWFICLRYSTPVGSQGPPCSPLRYTFSRSLAMSMYIPSSTDADWSEESTVRTLRPVLSFVFLADLLAVNPQVGHDVVPNFSHYEERHTGNPPTRARSRHVPSFPEPLALKPVRFLRQPNRLSWVELPNTYPRERGVEDASALHHRVARGEREAQIGEP